MHLKYVFFLLIYTLYTSPVYSSQKVLLINSYHPQYNWTAELTKGVQQSLSNDIAAENLFIEFMDQRRFIDDSIYYQKLITLLKYKYSKNHPDIIITSDDAAFNFILEFGQDLFPNTPIVFSGVNVFDPLSINNRTNITGIAEGMDIQGNLDLIVRIQPSVKKIILLGDTTGLGLRMVNAAKVIKETWGSNAAQSRVSLEILDDFSLEELYQRVGKLPSDTAILMLAIHQDKLGQYFSFQEHLPLLSQKSTVPIYGMWGGLMIGYGVIGGMMNDPYEHGYNTAQLALSILSGTPVDQIPIKLSAEYNPRFDFIQLQRFNLDDSLLPKDSVTFNKPMSVYQRYRFIINTVIAVFIFLVLIISIMIRNIYQRTAIQKKLNEFNLKLEKTVRKRTIELERRNNDLVLASESMRNLAHTDSLTELKNRRAASKDIPTYIKRHNISNEPLVLAILDVDHFKKINDNFGHQVGDSVLQALAEKLTNSLRPNDRVYRWGGEEFVMLLPQTPKEEANSICERLADTIRLLDVEGVNNITVSIGISELQIHDNYDAMVGRADTALYQAKNTGRNQIIVS